MSKELHLEDSLSYVKTATAANEKKLEFTFPAADVTSLYNEILKAAQKQAQISGFRPGKAPAAVVAKRYADYIMNDLRQELQQTAIKKLVDDKELDAISIAFADRDANPELGKDFLVTINVELTPTFDLPQYKGLKLEIEEGKSKDELFEEELTNLRNVSTETVSVTGPAQDGDILKVTYTGDFQLAEDAAPALKRMVSATGAWMWLSSKEGTETLPGINALLLGKSQGDKFDAELTFPEDWREEALASKTVKYAVTVDEISRRQPLDDDTIAKRVGLENAEALKKTIGERVDMRMEGEKLEKKVAKAKELLLPVVENIELPKKYVEETVQRELRKIASNLVKSEKDVESFKADHDKHMEEAKKNADKSVRMEFLVRKIAKTEDIKVSKHEVESQIRYICAMSGYKKADTEKILGNEEILMNVEQEMLEQKVFKFVVENEEK